MDEIDLYECRFDAAPSVHARFFEHPGGGIQVTAAHKTRTRVHGRNDAADESDDIVLVLVADLSCLGHPNRGFSATNSMDEIVSRFRVLASRFAVNTNMLVWVELDSDGHFDMVFPTSGSCDFGPLRSISGRVPARSPQAFAELFPLLGPAVLARLPPATSGAAAHRRSARP